jgi:hypothetical protein
MATTAANSYQLTYQTGTSQGTIQLKFGEGNPANANVAGDSYLTLMGRNYSNGATQGYGYAINQNYIKLTQNFANTNTNHMANRAKVLPGQLVYDSAPTDGTPNKLYLATGNVANDFANISKTEVLTKDNSLNRIVYVGSDVTINDPSGNIDLNVNKNSGTSNGNVINFTFTAGNIANGYANVANATYTFTETEATFKGAIVANSNVTFNGANTYIANVANFKIANGTVGQFLQTDGNANVTWATVTVDKLSNGTSNVSIPAANGNVNMSVGGTANVLVVTSTGANVTGNLSAANLIGPLASGNTNITLTANGAINFDATSTNVMRLSSTGANLFTSLTSNANITVTNANIAVANGNITVSNGSFIGNVTGNLNNGNSNIVIDTNANIRISSSGQANIINVSSNGTFAITTVSGNLVAANFIGTLANGNSNVGITSNGNVTTYVAGNANARMTVTSTGANIDGTLNVTGAVTVGNSTTTDVVANTATASANIFNNLTTGNVTMLANAQTINFGTLNSSLNGTYNFITGAAASGLTKTINFGTGAADGSNTFITMGVVTANTATTSNVNIQGNLNTYKISTGSPGSNTTASGSFIPGKTYTITANGNTDFTAIGATSNAIGTLFTANGVGSSSSDTAQLTGQIDGKWVLTTGSTLSSTYADLAEYYSSELDIPPGTVVEFGGTQEVQMCDTRNSTRIAGVVSTDPAYVMNEKTGQSVPRILVALIGRVPCHVYGTCAKGDMLVAAGGGYAMVNNSPAMGSVIGKALEDKPTPGIGTIEVVVGRM